MTFRGFYIESKSFMDYENLSFLDKLKFWFKYPISYMRFKYIIYKECKKYNNYTREKSDTFIGIYKCEECGGSLVKINSKVEVKDMVKDLFKCKSCGRCVFI